MAENQDEKYRCNCLRCCDKLTEGECAEMRMNSHMAEVVQLIKQSPMVLLIVGSEKFKITCHKFLLTFYSKFFEKAFDGAFAEAQTNEIRLPEDSASYMSTFVSWLYSGRLQYDDTVDALFSLWVLGDKLGAPEFTNDVMYVNFDFDLVAFLTPIAVKFVYSNTVPGSKLRKYVAQTLRSEGPFSDFTDESVVDSNSRAAALWVKLFAEGGDLVLDVIDSDLHGRDPTKSPYIILDGNISPYLEAESVKWALEWRIEKMRIEGEKESRNVAGIQVLKKE